MQAVDVLQCRVVLLRFNETWQGKCIHGVNAATLVRLYLWVPKLVFHKVTIISSYRLCERDSYDGLKITIMGSPLNGISRNLQSVTHI